VATVVGQLVEQPISSHQTNTGS